jgi:TolB-like protein/Tfp pilus assembly protein PilF
MVDGPRRRLAAIVAIDVVGYSRLMGVDEPGTLARLKEHRADTDPIGEKHGGRIVGTAGDGLLLEFPSVVEAVSSAIEVQTLMAERNANLPDDKKMLYRIGIHLGDVMIDGDDIFGDGVNIAARIEPLADPGGVSVSDDAYRQVRDRLEVNWEDGGEHEAKNIVRPIQVWRWKAKQAAAPDGPAVMNEHLPLPDKPSIAVLPFDNMSGDPEQDYFADGITEDIITALSRFHWLFVIARNSSFTYKGRSVDVRHVSRDLSVRYILEGSIRKAGERVRITAQLIDGETANHIWAEKYDRLLTDIFDLQDEITAKIAAATQPALYAAESSRVDTKNPEDLDAWDLHLRARDVAHRGTKEAVQESLAIAAKALAMDSSSSGAAKVLASSLYQKVISGWSENRGQDFAQALLNAEKAVAVDQSDAETHQILGLIYLGYRRYDEAFSELNSAIELNPNYAQGYVSLGTYHNYLGEPEKALPLFEKAMEISPRDLSLTFWRCTQSLGWMLAGEYEKAIEGAKFSAKRKDYWAPSRWYWAASAALAGNQEELDQARQEVLRLNPDFNISALRKAHPFRRERDFEILASGLRKANLPD